MSRRGNSEGSIYKRSDGRWAATVSLDRGRRKTFYGKTRADAAGKLTQGLSDKAKRKAMPNEKLTVGAFLERWLSDVAAPKVRATTLLGYSRMARLHILPALGHLRIAHLDAQTLTRFYRTLERDGLSPKYVRLIHALLYGVLEKARVWEVVSKNAAVDADPPAIARKEFRTLSLAEARHFLATARDESHYPVYVLALTCGMRQGELLGLRWSDVDLDESWLSVAQQAQRIGKEWVFTAPKTKRGTRRLPLPNIAVDALREQRVRVASQRLRAVAWEDHDLVFPNQVGRPLEKQNLVFRSFKPLLARAGLPDMRFHDLRHSTATIMLSMGEHPRVVQERLGHSTIAVTMDVYSHVMPTLQEESAARLDKVFAAS